MEHPSIYLFSVFLLLRTGCQDTPTPPAAVLENFKDYYSGEIFLTERARLEGSDSTTLRQRLDSLGARFDFSLGGRDSLLRYYRDSLPRWETFLKEVLRRLEERERALGKEHATLQAGRPGKD